MYAIYFGEDNFLQGKPFTHEVPVMGGPMEQCSCGDWLDPDTETFPPDGIEHRKEPHGCDQESHHRTRTIEDPTPRCAGCGEEWPD